MKFELPNSEVVTSATFVMRYRLAPQLSDQASLLNLVINGIGSGFSVPLLHSSAESDATSSGLISIPAELFTENTLEFQLAGVCGGANCGSPSVITVIQPTSKLDLVGRRLALASDLSLLVRPSFIRPAMLPRFLSLF